MAYLGDCDDNYFDEDYDDDVWDFGDPVSSKMAEPMIVVNDPTNVSHKSGIDIWKSSRGDPVPCPSFDKPKGVHAGRGCGTPRLCNMPGFSLVDANSPGSHGPRASASHLQGNDQALAQNQQCISDTKNKILANSASTSASVEINDQSNVLSNHGAAENKVRKNGSTSQKIPGIGRGVLSRCLYSETDAATLGSDIGQTVSSDIGKSVTLGQNRGETIMIDQHQDGDLARTWLNKLLSASGVETLPSTVPTGSEHVSVCMCVELLIIYFKD